MAAASDRGEIGYRVRPVLARRLLGGAVLLRVASRPDTLRLDGSASAIWSELRAAGGHGITAADLTAALARAHDVDPDDIAGDVERTLDRLVADGAVETSQS